MEEGENFKLPDVQPDVTLMSREDLEVYALHCDNMLRAGRRSDTKMEIIIEDWARAGGPFFTPAETAIFVKLLQSQGRNVATETLRVALGRAQRAGHTVEPSLGAVRVIIHRLRTKLSRYVGFDLSSQHKNGYWVAKEQIDKFLARQFPPPRTPEDVYVPVNPNEIARLRRYKVEPLMDAGHTRREVATILGENYPVINMDFYVISQKRKSLTKKGT